MFKRRSIDVKRDVEVTSGLCPFSTHDEKGVC